MSTFNFWPYLVPRPRFRPVARTEYQFYNQYYSIFWGFRPVSRNFELPRVIWSLFVCCIPLLYIDKAQYILKIMNENPALDITGTGTRHSTYDRSDFHISIYHHLFSLLTKIQKAEKEVISLRQARRHTWSWEWQLREIMGRGSRKQFIFFSNILLIQQYNTYAVCKKISNVVTILQNYWKPTSHRL